jgi:transcriptional regulator with XRE-family HTH domain
VQGSPRERVADTVRAELARRRVSQAQLSAALGVSQPAISRRLTGAVPFTVDELHAVAALLGLPAGSLLGEPVTSAVEAS